MIITATALAADAYEEVHIERSNGNVGGSLFALILFYSMDVVLVSILAGSL